MIRKIVLIIGFVLLVVAGGIAYWLKGFKTLVKEAKEVDYQTMLPDGTTTPSLFPEAAIAPVDWRVYRNEKYGFEVKYPKNWEIFLDPSNDKGAAFYDPNLPSFYNGSAKGNYTVGVISVEYVESFPLSSIAERMVLATSGKQSEEIQIGDLYKGRFSRSPGALSVIFNVERKVYTFSMLYLHKARSNEERENLEQIFFQVLRSFRITKM